MKAKSGSVVMGQLIGLLFCAALASGHAPGIQESSAAKEQNKQQSTVTVPSRPQNSLYKGEQGPQRSEVEFTPSSRKVVMKLRVQDPSGYFVPAIRRENFAVYEDGVRQKDVDVEIEHAPVSVAVLLEFGGRYHELNKTLAMTISQAGRQLLDVIEPNDKVAVLKYSSSLETLADFSQGRDALAKIFDGVETPGSSEANFYDALLETIHRMQAVNGRKAIIVISSGVDTFSKASNEQVLQAARDASIPIYAIGLGSIMKQEALVYGPAAPFSHVDWSGAENHLEALANASGGRAYEPGTDFEFAAIFDDIMENLRLRYVITYVSSNPATSGKPRRIRVELIDPNTGGPLKIWDSNGKTISAEVLVQETYSPSGA